MIKVHPEGKMALIQGFMLGMKSHIPPHRDNLISMQIAMIRITRAIDELLEMIEADIQAEEISDPRDNKMIQQTYPDG